MRDEPTMANGRGMPWPEGLDAMAALEESAQLLRDGAMYRQLARLEALRSVDVIGELERTRQELAEARAALKIRDAEIVQLRIRLDRHRTVPRTTYDMVCFERDALKRHIEDILGKDEETA